MDKVACCALMTLCFFALVAAGCGKGDGTTAPDSGPADAGSPDTGIQVTCGVHSIKAGIMCACDEGWADCDNDQSDGCEIELASDPAHCGRCARACAGGAACVDGFCLPAAPALAVIDTALTDENGFTVTLNGVNIANQSKTIKPGYLPAFTDDDWARVSRMGMNAVRFLVFHEAVEPGASVYDEDYIGSVRLAVKRLTAQGIWVVIDVHQDVYGDGFGFTGLPKWTCDQKYYDQFKLQDPWWANYFDAGVQACFGGFWRSADLQSHYCQGVARIWNVVKDDPYVIGIDFFNEPYFGDNMDAVQFEKQYLSGLYLACIDALNAGGSVGFSGIAFVEPYVTAPYMKEVRLDIGAIKKAHDRVVFAPHYYLPDIHESKGYDGDTTPIKAYVDWVAQYGSDHHVPVWMGEYGGPATAPGVTLYLNDLTGIMDADRVGRTIWSYDVTGDGFSMINDDRTPKPAIYDVLVRPYVERTKGDVAWTRDGTKLTFTSTSTGHVIVVVPQEYTPDPAPPPNVITDIPGPLTRVYIKVSKAAPVALTFTRTAQ